MGILKKEGQEENIKSEARNPKSETNPNVQWPKFKTKPKS